MNNEITIGGKVFTRTGEKPREVHREPDKDHGPANYRQPDPLNTGLQGKRAMIILATGGRVYGVITHVGQYFLELSPYNFPNEPPGKTLLVSKGGIIALEVLS